MAIPKPGKPVRGSTTGAPIMALFDLLGRRWAMGIIWNLYRGPATFRSLQGACESKGSTISPAVLNGRIKDLQDAKLLERTVDGYRLTELGRELFLLLEPLAPWSRKWGKALAPSSRQAATRPLASR